jgi:hypothetical protein
MSNNPTYTDTIGKTYFYQARITGTQSPVWRECMMYTNTLYKTKLQKRATRIARGCVLNLAPKQS